MKKIKNKEEFQELIRVYDDRFIWAKTYVNSSPHEYLIGIDDKEKLEDIRRLNRYIQENYDEIENFEGKEYQVLFVDYHKYWSVGDWKTTIILNRNWDFKDDKGNIDKTMTNIMKKIMADENNIK